MFVITYAAGALATAYAVIAAAFLLRRREPLELVLSLYLLTAATLIACNAAADVSYTVPAVVVFSGFAFISIGLNLACFLVLIDVLVDRRLPSERRILLYVGINLAPSLFSFSKYGVTDVLFLGNAPAQIVPGVLYSISFLLIIIDFTYGIVRVVRGFAQEVDEAMRMQLVFVAAGLLIAIIGLLVFDVALPLLGEYRFYTLGPMASIAFVFGCGYAICRHKLIELRLVISHLESKVKERTQELRKLHERQQRMIVDLSHNLQTPLTVLKCKLERLDRTLLHDTDTKTICQSVDAISRVISDMLALVNLDGALQSTPRIPLSLSCLVDEIAEELTVIAEAKGISVIARTESNIHILGDARHVREAITNITCNAVKYIGESGTKEIGLSLMRKGGMAVLLVKDSGTGIAPQDLPHVFDRFYRGSNQMYGKEPGSGVGLSIVAKIIKEHGGSVNVESGVGRGSSFTLRLPLHHPQGS